MVVFGIALVNVAFVVVFGVVLIDFVVLVVIGSIFVGVIVVAIGSVFVDLIIVVVIGRIPVLMSSIMASLLSYSMVSLSMQSWLFSVLYLLL